MSKGAGGTRLTANGGGNSSTPKAYTSTDSLLGLNQTESKTALSQIEGTVKAITNSGGNVGDGWKVMEAARNRVMLQGMLGPTFSNTPEGIKAIDGVKLNMTFANRTSQYDYITDGTSMYMVTRVNKDGSIRATREYYEKTPSGYKRTGDTIKLKKNDAIYLYTGKTQALYDVMLKKALYNAKNMK